MTQQDQIIYAKSKIVFTVSQDYIYIISSTYLVVYFIFLILSLLWGFFVKPVFWNAYCSFFLKYLQNVFNFTKFLFNNFTAF